MRPSKVFLRVLFLFIVLVGFYACSSDDAEPQLVNKPPIELACDYFDVDRVLSSDPERAVYYLISCEMQNNGSTIEIEPGMVIEFTQNGSIHQKGNSEGALIAAGTAEHPIIFRGTDNTRGHWKGITFKSDDINNELSHVTIENAGKGAADKAAAISVIEKGFLKIKNTDVSNNKNYGLYLINSYRDSNRTEDNIVIENTKVYNNDVTAYVSLNKLGSLSPNNDFTGNDRDEFHISGGNDFTLYDATWHNHNVDYKFMDSPEFRSYITIKPGVKMVLSQAESIWVSKYDAGIKAVGTPQEPIIFTGESETPELWRGLFIRGDWPGNEIGHAIIEYLGNGTGGQSQYKNLTVTGKYLNIHNTTFRHINTSYCAIRYGNNTNMQISNITVEPAGCVSEEI